MSYIELKTNDIRFNFETVKKGSSIILYTKFNIDILIADFVDIVNQYIYIDSIVIYAGFDYYDDDVHCLIRYGLKSICHDEYPKDEFTTKIPAEVFRNYDFGRMYHIDDIMFSIFIKAIMNIKPIAGIEEKSWFKCVAAYVYFDQIIRIIVSKICNNATELIALEKDE